MKRSEPVELMNMCVLRRGSKVLVQDRTDPNWPGVAFPGGHVEKGESFTDAVIREVQEETGLTISSPRLCGIKDWCEDGVRHVVLLYRAEQFTGTLRSSDEGEVWWAELAGLPSLDLASSDMLDLLRVFEEDDLNELFYRQNGEVGVAAGVKTPIPTAVRKHAIWDHKTYHKYFLFHKLPE